MRKQGLIRRNGQLQACEPCRKAKIRCGHEDPTCARCVRLAITCEYDPAPMTKPRLGTNLKNRPVVKSPIREPIYRAPGSMSLASPPVLTPQSTPGVLSPESSHIFKRPATGVGSTKFNASFSENDANFGVELSYSGPDGDEGQQACTSDASQARPPIPDEKLRLGISILSRFPSSRTQKHILRSIYQTLDIWTSPAMIDHCLSTFQERYDRYLQNPDDLAIVAADLCFNTRQSLHNTEEPSWHNWFGGPLIRWEMIGIVFACFGIAFYNLQEWDPIFELPEQESRNRKTAAMHMRDAAEDCVKLCNESNMNDIVVVLVKNMYRLESLLIGDENDQLTSKSFSLFAHVITVGLHRLPATNTLTPLSEYRRSLGASAYYLDKSGCIFAAHPPGMSRMYCTYDIPLDLSEQQLFGGPDVLNKAIAELDPDGWNTKGAIYASTWLRSRCFLTPFMERILEMHLGVNPQFTCAEIDDMLSRLADVEKTFPSQICYASVQPATRTKPRSGVEIYVVTRIYLESLRCYFVLEKLKLSRSWASGQKVLNIAQEMMNAVLSFWLNRDQLQQHQAAFDWLIVCYGIPSAGVLCVELLKSSKPPPNSNTSPLQFSRSDVIQALMMFVAFLDWARPTDGNYYLCNKLRKVIKRIVDSVLNAPMQLPSVETPAMKISTDTSDAQVESGQQYTNPEDVLPPMGETDDLNWLNEIDWTQGDWLDFSEPVGFGFH